MEPELPYSRCGGFEHHACIPDTEVNLLAGLDVPLVNHRSVLVYAEARPRKEHTVPLEYQRELYGYVGEQILGGAPQILLVYVDRRLSLYLVEPVSLRLRYHHLLSYGYPREVVVSGHVKIRRHNRGSHPADRQDLLSREGERSPKGKVVSGKSSGEDSAGAVAIEGFHHLVPVRSESVHEGYDKSGVAFPQGRGKLLRHGGGVFPVRDCGFDPAFFEDAHGHHR